MTDDRSIDVAERVLGPLARREAPFGARTTYRVGGRAALLVEVTVEAELPTLVDALAASGAPVFVLGKGSNLLVADAGFLGVVVVLGDGWESVVVDRDRGVVDAGGATALPVLARRCAAASVTGLEWAVGIPGSVGGAVRMNAGGHGCETVDRLLDARVLRLDEAREERLDSADLELSYRYSVLRPCDLVLDARYRP